MTRGLIVAIAAVALADLAMLAGARVDRASDDLVLVTLDERELRLVVPADGSTSLQLRFAGVLDGPRWPLTDDTHPGWIAPAQLDALGFDVSVPAGDPRAAQHYGALLARPAAVAFDVGTDAWDRRVAEWSARRRAAAASALAENAPAVVDTDIATVAARTSRLVPIDIGGDAAVLRGTYRQRQNTLILAAVVAVQFDSGQRLHSRAEVTGTVTDVLPPTLQVPARLLPVFTGLAPAGVAATPRVGAPLPHPPRYDVTLAVGPALRPWIVDARRLASPR